MRRPGPRWRSSTRADELLAARHQPRDESVLLDLLFGQTKHTGWQASYLREHAAEHAAAADRLDQLLEDPRYLISVDPARLVPHLDSARSAPARAIAAVYRQKANPLADLDQPTRASQLELAARQLGCPSLADRIARAARLALADPLVPWSPGREPPGPHRPRRRGVRGGGRGAAGWYPGHRQRRPQVSAGVAAGRRRPGRGADTGHSLGVHAVAVGALPDGTPVVVSGIDAYVNPYGVMQVWRLADGTPLKPSLYLSKQVRGIAVHSNVIVTAAGAGIAVHQLLLP